MLSAVAALWTGTAAAKDAGYWDPSERMPKEVNVDTVTATTRSLGAGWYSFSEDITIDGTLALESDANLILEDDATLTIKGGIAGEGYNLTVWGREDQTGKLVVTGTNGVNGAARSYSGCIRGILRPKSETRGSWVDLGEGSRGF